MMRLLRHPSVVITALLVAGLLAFHTWSRVSGAAKFAAVSGEAGADGRLSAEIVLNVTPERFHIELMQDAGRVVEIKGRSIFLADLPAERALAIARNYWVAELRRWRPNAA